MKPLKAILWLSLPALLPFASPQPGVKPDRPATARTQASESSQPRRLTPGDSVLPMGSPFQEVLYWHPSSSTSRRTLLLIHGNQGEIDDPCWMIDLRLHTALAGHPMIAPSLRGGDFRWDRPNVRRALVRLLSDLRVAAADVVLLGYSAGGSRLLSLSAELGVPVPLISVAGDLGRPLRLGQIARARLQPAPVLFVCNSQDRGPNASCALDRRNASSLRALGFARITHRRRQGDHEFDMPHVAPMVSGWLRENP